MHDRNGTELRTGDRVLVECTIAELSPSEDYCNVDLETISGRRPDQHKERISGINTGVVTLLSRAAPAPG